MSSVVEVVVAVVNGGEMSLTRGNYMNILDFSYDALPKAYELAKEENVHFQIIVNGDVCLASYKHSKNDPRPIPNFKRVIVYGNFDCSNQKDITNFPIIVSGHFNCSNLLSKGFDIIESKTNLPIIMKSLDCSYSIKSLTDLIGRIPYDLRQLMVQSQLIKYSVLSKDAEKYEAAKTFCEEYPDLIVTNSNGSVNLAEELKKFDEKAEVKVEKTTVVTAVKKPELKTSDWLDRDEIVKKLHQDFNEFSEFSYDDLRNIVKRALNRNKNFVHQEQKNKNGTDVQCVSVKEFDLIVPCVRDYIAEQKRREEQEKEFVAFIGPSKEKSEEKPQETQVEEIKDEVIYVEKYISKQVYNRISSLDNTPEILERLDGVNIDFSEINRQTGIIFINGKKYEGLRLKRPDCIVSSFKDNMEDPKRMVIRQVYDINNRPIYICTDYFGTHTGSKKITDEYKATWTKDLGKNILEAIKNKDNYITLMELRQNGYKWEK